MRSMLLVLMANQWISITLRYTDKCYLRMVRSREFAGRYSLNQTHIFMKVNVRMTKKEMALEDKSMLMVITM
jgi:hypothetical protein